MIPTPIIQEYNYFYRVIWQDNNHRMYVCFWKYPFTPRHGFLSSISINGRYGKTLTNTSQVTRALKKTFNSPFPKSS